RIDLELARGHVDDALDGVRGLRAAGAAVGTRWRRVREETSRLHVNGRRGVHPGDATDVVGAWAGAARREIGPDVQVDGHAEGQKLAVGVEGQLGGRDVVTAVLVGHEPLAPV